MNQSAEIGVVTERQAPVLDLLMSVPAATTPEVARATGLSGRQVYSALRQLERKGLATSYRCDAFASVGWSAVTGGTA